MTDHPPLRQQRRAWSDKLREAEWWLAQARKSAKSRDYAKSRSGALMACFLLGDACQYAITDGSRVKALARITAALAEGPATAQELVELTGIPKDSCRAHLWELVNSGVVANDRRVEREIVRTRNVILYTLTRPHANAGRGE